MQNASLPTIAGVMLASFAATVGYLWWQREPAPPGGTAVLPAVQAPAPVLNSAPPVAANPSNAPQVAQVMQPSHAPAAEAEATDTLDQDPPLMVNVVPNRAFVPDEQSEGDRRVLKDTFDVIVTNQSEKAIDVEVTEITLATLDKASFEFTLAKGNQRHVTARDGLPMHSGDQLTIKAPKYRELTASIPY